MSLLVSPVDPRVRVIQASEYPLLPLLFHSTGNDLALASADFSGTEPISLWNLTDGVRTVQFQGSELPVNGMAVAEVSQGRHVLGVAHDEGFGCWDIRTGNPLSEPIDVNTVFEVAAYLGEDGRAKFAGAGNDNLVHRWDAETASPLEPLAGHRGSVLSVAATVTPDGNSMIVTGGDDGTVRRWSANTGTQIGDPLLDDPEVTVTEVDTCILSGGRILIACADSEGKVHRWDGATGRALGRPILTSGIVSLSTASVHGEARLIGSSNDDEVRQWDGTTGTQLDQKFPGYAVTSASTSNGVALVAAGDRDGAIAIHVLSE